MQELSDQQLFQALHYARSHDEQAGRAILQRFQTSQAAFSQTIFSVFPSVIADLDQAMAHLFMDLCFDVIAVYEHAFGKAPDQRIVGNRWFEDKAKQFEPEMKAAMAKVKPNASAKNLEKEQQKGLVNFLHAAIDEQGCDSPAAIRLTKLMIFTTVQLFDALYDADQGRQSRAVH